MYKITLDKEDFLRFQLYTASKSKRIKNRRLRSWIFTTLFFVLMVLITSENEDSFLYIYFAAAACANFILYPYYTRWRYKMHYKKHIEDHYETKCGVESLFTITSEYILSQDHTGESKIMISEIKEIIEIEKDIFIKIKSGEAFIIPKRIPDIGQLSKELKILCNSKEINWNTELEWKWK